MLFGGPMCCCCPRLQTTERELPTMPPPPLPLLRHHSLWMNVPILSKLSRSAVALAIAPASRFLKLPHAAPEVSKVVAAGRMRSCRAATAVRLVLPRPGAPTLVSANPSDSECAHAAAALQRVPTVLAGAEPKECDFSPGQATESGLVLSWATPPKRSRSLKQWKPRILLKMPAQCSSASVVRAWAQAAPHAGSVVAAAR
jgi:hypothetical protein